MSSSTPVATTEVMFQPVQVGRYELAHRIVMAPLSVPPNSGSEGVVDLGQNYSTS